MNLEYLDDFWCFKETGLRCRKNPEFIFSFHRKPKLHGVCIECFEILGAGKVYIGSLPTLLCVSLFKKLIPLLKKELREREKEVLDVGYILCRGFQKVFDKVSYRSLT
jgi:hypothetical protein